MVELDRRAFLQFLTVPFLGAALDSREVGAQQASRMILFLPGYQDLTTPQWFLNAQRVLESRGIGKCQIINLGQNGYGEGYLEQVHETVMRLPGSNDLVGVSAGGGAIQMYLDYFNPVSASGERKIRRAILISARNLYVYDPDNVNYASLYGTVPSELRSFYRRLGDPVIVRSKVEEIRVAHGENDSSVKKRNGETLAEAFGVPLMVVGTGHEGVFGNQDNLARVVS